MGQHLTYTTRLVFDSDEDERAMFEVLEAQRFAYNECSKVRFNETTKNSITELHGLFYRKFRDAHPHIKSQIVIRAEHECLSMYRSMKGNKVKPSKPCQKKRLSMRLDKRLYSRKRADAFRFTTLDDPIDVRLQVYTRLRKMLDTYEICDPLLFVKDNEIWIALTFDVPVLEVRERFTVGVDLGVRIAAVTSEGKFYCDKKFNAEKRKLRYLKRQLQSAKAKNGSRTAKKHLRKLRRKERNKNKNQTHHLANAILRDTDADVIVLEDLSKIKRKKKGYENKNRISQVPFYQLKEMLSYKATLQGRKVITIDPRYTSQEDHRTGLKDGTRRGRRYYGSDGIVLDADHNAAINIAKRSKLPISQVALLDGQAVVNQPYASEVQEASSRPRAVSS